MASVTPFNCVMRVRLLTRPHLELAVTGTGAISLSDSVRGALRRTANKSLSRRNRTQATTARLIA